MGVMRIQILAVCLFALAGCGGGDGGDAPPPAAPAPPPVVPTPPPVIGANGGTITETSGATVTFPAGALRSDTTFRVAIDSTGAPPIPAGLTAAGNMYVITPHGGDFADAVQVSIPAPSVTLQPNQQLKLAKAQPDGQWQLLDTVAANGKLTANVTSFSFFMSVIVTYVLPIATVEPFRYDTTLTCGGTTNCTGLVGPTEVVFTLTGNNGQLPQNCTNPSVQLVDHSTGRDVFGAVIPLSGYVHRVTALPGIFGSYVIAARLTCGGAWANDWQARVYWDRGPSYPQLRIERMPAQVDVVEGLAANVDVVMSGGNVRVLGPGNGTLRPPTADDRAIIDWQRSDDAGASWRTVARSFQNEGNPLPFGGGLPWQPWSVRHGFIATSADQGALIRLTACYTPPTAMPPPCVSSTATRINVLQQSALPAIATQPRSVLIRTAETANFSASASGAPAPTLQWQTRPANSTGAWTDVTTGTGATTLNYTTAPGAISDNGVQYRVVATNAVGSAASAAVTISVSEFDVAPSITTQPASLGVTSGGDAVFAVDAFGTEAMSYQWRFNGADLAGANSPVLRLNGVTNANAGSYLVWVTNAAGNAVSNAATLTVTAGAPAITAPTIVTQPIPTTVNVGQTATLAVGVAGTGPFTFQWRRNDVDIPGATSAVLTFNAAALPNVGDYGVVVTNSAGSTNSDVVLLDVHAAAGLVGPTITSQPATLIVPFTGSGTIAVGATGSGPLAYQWYRDGGLLPGSTLPVLNFATLGQSDFGTYTVTVTNVMSSVTSQPAQLILLGAPVITLQPVAVTVIEGANAMFFVQADSSGLRYQWSVNGTPIPGAIAATFNTDPLVAANSGAVYSVMVYNAAGHVFSQGAVLTVQTVTLPSVTQQPANATIAPGAAAQMCVTFGGTPPFDVSLQRWTGAWTDVGASVSVADNAQHCRSTPVLQLADDGAQFRFLATNPAGQTTTNAATVTVSAPGLVATTMVSVAMSGNSPGFTSGNSSVSADGRYVAFISNGIDLVPGTTVNGHAYVRDLVTGVTTLIDRTPGGAESNRAVYEIKISSNGRYAIFNSESDDIVPNTGFATTDVFRADLVTGAIVQVNVLPNGDPGPSFGGTGPALLDISGDGRIVIFRNAFDLTSPGGDPNPNYFLYSRDMTMGVTRLVFGSPTDQAGYAALSDNGEYVAYIVPAFAPQLQTISLYDLEASTNYPAIFSFDVTAPAALWSGIDVSSDGRYVAFAMKSPALFGGSVDAQVVMFDRTAPGVLELISTGGDGIGIGNSSRPQMSGDGRHVLFSTQAGNLSPVAGIAFSSAIVRRDRVAQTTTTASRSPSGALVQAGSLGEYAISRDGAVFSFTVEEQLMDGPSGFGFQVYAAPRP
jgi:hypothetical protein